MNPVAKPRARREWISGVAALGMACASGLAQAMGGLLLLDPPPTGQSRLAVGASLWSFYTQAVPHRHHSLLLPALDYSAPSGLFVSTDNGLGWNLSHRADVQAGVRLSAQPARQALAQLAGEDTARIGTRVERGAFLNYSPTDALLLQSGVRRGSGRHRDGVVAEAGATSGLPLPGGDLLGLTAGVTWANRAFRSSYLGTGTVAPPGPGGGWHDVQLAFSEEHHLSPEWRIDSQLQLSRLTGHRPAASAAQGRYQGLLSIGLWKDIR
ncbi:MAG: MipA/OmpV family protein [Burkholderiales bacterium]